MEILMYLEDDEFPSPQENVEKVVSWLKNANLRPNINLLNIIDHKAIQKAIRISYRPGRWYFDDDELKKAITVTKEGFAKDVLDAMVSDFKKYGFNATATVEIGDTVKILQEKSEALGSDAIFIMSKRKNIRSLGEEEDTVNVDILKSTKKPVMVFTPKKSGFTNP